LELVGDMRNYRKLTGREGEEEEEVCFKLIDLKAM
jgi:hypothetical protein